MSKIIFYKLDIERSELRKIVNAFEYDYDSNTEEWFSANSAVCFNGKTWTLEEAVKEVEGKLEFGNRRQIEALKALELFNLVFNYHISLPYFINNHNELPKKEYCDAGDFDE